MPQIKKYDDEFRMKCFDLYCEGKSSKQIAKIMGVTSPVIKRLKLRKFPKDWDKGRTERVLKKTEKLEEFALESLIKMQVRHQKMLRELAEKSHAAFIRKIERDEVDSKTLVGAFFKSLEEERKLYVPLEVIYGAKILQQTTIGVNQHRGDSQVLAVFNKMFEEAHPELNHTENG